MAALILLGGIQACGEPSHPPALRLTAGAVCDGCGGIRIASAVTLQDPDRTAAVPALARVAEDGSIWVVSGRDIRVFDAAGVQDHVLTDVVTDGDVVGTVPDPFGVRSIGDIEFAGADSVLIIDTAAHRIVVLDRTGSGSRAVQLPAAARLRSAVVVDWPERVLVTGRVGANTGLFELSAVDGHGVIRRDRYSAAEPTASQPYHLPRKFAAGVWAVDGVPAVSRWDDSGRVRTQVGRLPGRRSAWSGPRDRGSPRIAAVAEDGTGRIWVFARIATEQASAAWRSPEARRPGGRIDAGIEALYHTHVEVVDPTSLRPLARAEVAAWLVSAAGSSDAGDSITAVFRAADVDGVYATHVYELELDDTR